MEMFIINYIIYRLHNDLQHNKGIILGNRAEILDAARWKAWEAVQGHQPSVK